jgi:hypothetical protein
MTSTAHAKRSRLGIAAFVAACGIAASAAAASPAAAASALPATATQPTAGAANDLRAAGAHQDSVGPVPVPGGSVRFTPIARPGQVTPNTAFTCGVSYPFVNDNFSNGEISWSASVSCNIVLRMQGTTVLFRWGSSSAYAFGSSYDNYSSFNSSSGAVYGIFSGTWGVNNNVLLFIPAGYSTTLGAGCYYVNSSQIHCTETTGPITAQ